MKKKTVHFRGSIRHPVPACGSKSKRTTIFIAAVTCGRCLNKIRADLNRALKAGQ